LAAIKEVREAPALLFVQLQHIRELVKIHLEHANTHLHLCLFRLVLFIQNTDTRFCYVWQQSTHSILNKRIVVSTAKTLTTIIIVIVVIIFVCVLHCLLLFLQCDVVLEPT